jgi:isopenicillin-N epimerase
MNLIKNRREFEPMPFADANLLHQPASDPREWTLDPAVTFLNHGSFGACPRRVLERQQEWRVRLERQPVQFLLRELEGELDTARAALASFVHAAAEDLAFVPNATTGVNTVLRSLEFAPGDELLVTNQEYNASRNALNYVAERAGARVVVAEIPFPFQHEDELVAPLLAAVTPRTRLALLDHVTSQTGVVFPLAKIIRALTERGVEVLVDGAHAPGMIPLDLAQLGATYYTGNCHKWLCAPKGAALLWVRRDRQPFIRPLAISHGANSRRTDRSRFLIEFGWVGTGDPSAWLSVPAALEFMGAQLPGGWPAVMARNRALALAARQGLAEALNIPAPCPPEFIGSLAALPLPDAPDRALPRPPWIEYPLQNVLRGRHGFEVPVIPWPSAPRRLVRVAAQLYNALPQYEMLGRALVEELGRE